MLHLINLTAPYTSIKEGTVMNPILLVRQTEARRVTFLRCHHWEGVEPEFEARQPTPPGLYLADMPPFSQKVCGMGEHRLQRFKAPEHRVANPFILTDSIRIGTQGDTTASNPASHI